MNTRWITGLELDDGTDRTYREDADRPGVVLTYKYGELDYRLEARHIADIAERHEILIACLRRDGWPLPRKERRGRSIKV